MKLHLIHWLAEVQDKTILEKVQAFKDEHEAQMLPENQNLVQERLETYQRDPNAVLNWDDVMAELEKDL